MSESGADNVTAKADDLLASLETFVVREQAAVEAMTREIIEVERQRMALRSDTRTETTAPTTDRLRVLRRGRALARLPGRLVRIVLHRRRDGLDDMSR